MNATRIMRMIVVATILSGVLWSAVQAQSEATQSPGPPKTQEPQDKPRTETRPAAAQDKIHPGVRSKLEKSEDGKVYVLVTLKPLPKEGLTKAQRRVLAKEKQDKLLAKLAEGEFTVDHRFATEPRMIGDVNAAGVAKLAKDQAVFAVEQSKIKPEVFPAVQQSESKRVVVIIVLGDLHWAPTSREDKKKLGKALQDRVLNRLVPEEFELLGRLGYRGLGLRIGADGLEKLAVDPDVLSVMLDMPLRHGAVRKPQPVRYAALNSVLLHIGANTVHDQGWRGRFVTVAVIDDGIDCNHIDLVGSCVGDPIIHHPDEHAGPTSGHGTMIAAIISANGTMPGSVTGIAPLARIWPVKVQSGIGLFFAIRDIIKDRHTVPNLRVINISVSTGGDTLQESNCYCEGVGTILIEEEISKANAAGIIVFSSSGNEGKCGRMAVPACVPSCVAVAAVYEANQAGFHPYPYCDEIGGPADRITCFSNRPADNNDCKILGAPGVDVVLTGGSTPGNVPTDGTSWASAVASGVAALMFEKLGCPDGGPTAAQVQLVKGILYQTGVTAASDPHCSYNVFPKSIRALPAVFGVTTQCTSMGDLNCDGQVDGWDLAILIFCLFGPGHPPPGSPGVCSCVDYPSSPPDGDVDLHDFAQFQLAFSGTAQGACCDLNQECSDGLEEDCTGSYLGDFTKCADIQCDPIGACCQADGSCSLMTCEDCIGCGCPPNQCPCACAGAGGSYQGNGFDCGPGTCTQPDAGACCQQDGTCDDGMLEDDCLAANGTYQGDTILCINITCEQPVWPTGACCMMDGSCVDAQTEADCWATGWSYQGDGSTCATDACGPSGACCMGDGSCTEDLTIAECNTAGGTYEGDATVCSPNPCVQPAAACCDDIGGCLGDMTPAACTTAGGNYQGGGTMCMGYNCSVTGACCLPDEFCEDLSAPACAFQAGLYAGDPTACSDPGMDCSVDDDGGTQFGACQATEDRLLFDVNGAATAEFGIAVALSGGLAVVGAPGDTLPFPPLGSAHLFRLGAANCNVEQFRLTGSDSIAGDQFGFVVALRGGTAVVGAPNTFNEEFNNNGSAYVFEQPPLGWQDMFQNAILNKSTLESKDGFAKSVAIREDQSVVLVGSSTECLASDCDCNPNQADVGCGAVFVFLKPLFGWEDKTEDLIITADDGEQFDHFGVSVSISGTAAIVGADEEDEACGGGTNCDAGAAYVFRSNATGWTWIQEAKLTASDADSGDGFGTSVFISGNAAIVGSPFDNGAVGSAYVFRFDPQSGQWNQEAKLTASDGAADDEFGFSVSISGDLAVIGAHYEEDTASSSGSMYVFRFDGFDWNEEAKLTAWDASSGDNFGISVSVDGDRAVAGAKWGQGGANNSGAAYVFDGLGDCNKSQTTDLCDIINDPTLDCCPPHDCCDSTHGMGCSDAIIVACVCKIDSTCCTAEWDAECVALVEDEDCGTCDPGGNGIIDTCEYCPADLSGDGEVEAFDLALLLGAWGPCPGGCPEDLSGDCEVGAFDLAILLGCWGTCPCSAQAQWNGGPGKLGALRFALGGGSGCLSLEEAVQMMGHDDVGAFIEWVLSEVPPDWVYRVAQFLLWLLDNWPC